MALKKQGSIILLLPPLKVYKEREGKDVKERKEEKRGEKERKREKKRKMKEKGRKKEIKKFRLRHTLEIY